MAKTYKFGNGTWARKKGSTLAYSDTNNAFKPLPFSFERNSIATRVNKAGLIETVGNDIPRIDYTDNADGALLLENSATNSLLQSNQFNTTWTTSNITLTSEQVGVGGSTDAWKIEKTAANGYIRHIGINVVNGSVSVFAKKGVSNWLRLGTSSGNIETYFDLENGIIGNKGNLVDTSKIVDMGDGWYRCSFSYTGTATGVYLYPADNNGDTSQTSGSVYLQYCQIEAGSYATSYIPTSGSSVTRQADTATGSGNSEVFNDSEGVLFADISALANDGTLRTITLGDNSSSNAVSFRYDNPNQITLYLNSNGANQCSFVASVPTLLFNKCLIKYKANDFSAWVNGFEIGVDSSGITFSSGTLDRINFDIGYTSSNPFFGKTKEIAYYDEILTDLELETLTSYRSLNELVTELNLNTL